MFPGKAISSSPFKLAAREENVRIYQKLADTGKLQFPIKDRQYWTLCGEQTQEPWSEILQMHDLGLIENDSQFHGVDKDSNIISTNHQLHPDAHWYAGEWLEVISSVTFNPAFVYLDTTSWADHRTALGLVSKTMLLCPPNTLLLANVMLNDPRSRRQFDPTQLIRGLQRRVPHSELSRWLPKVENFRYRARGFTTMQTYVFYKER